MRRDEKFSGNCGFENRVIQTLLKTRSGGRSISNIIGVAKQFSNHRKTFNILYRVF
jgi:hypothetical protein